MTLEPLKKEPYPAFRIAEMIKGFDFTATWAPEDAADEDFDEDGLYLKTDFTVVTESEPVEGQVPYSEESVAR